ncbi:hypothetical protein STENM36S_00950 [Streptomyces tendae]
MVDEEAERRVEGAQGRFVGVLPAEPGPQPAGDRVPDVSVAQYGRQRGDEGGDEGARRAQYRVLGEVEAERVRDRRGDRGDAEPVGGAGVFGQGVDGAAGDGHGGFGGREGGVGTQLPGPQPLRHLLVGVAGGELDRVDAPVVVPVALDECEAGAHRQLLPGGRGRAAVAPVAPGEGPHLVGVEGAAPGAGRASAGELAAADVRVHGLGLHPEQFGRLPGGQAPLAVGGVLGLLIAHGVTVSIGGGSC